MRVCVGRVLARLKMTLVKTGCCLNVDLAKFVYFFKDYNLARFVFFQGLYKCHISTILFFLLTDETLDLERSGILET